MRYGWVCKKCYSEYFKNKESKLIPNITNEICFYCGSHIGDYYINYSVDDNNKVTLDGEFNLEQLVICSFCDKNQNDIKFIIVRSYEKSNIAICNECIGICCEIMFKNIKEIEWAKDIELESPVSK